VGIRFTDENGKRKRKTFKDKKAAALALEQAEIIVEERKRGLGPVEMVPKTWLDASKYWAENRAPKKRSYNDDLTIIKQLDAHFAELRLNDVGRWVVEVDRYAALECKLRSLVGPLTTG